MVRALQLAPEDWSVSALEALASEPQLVPARLLAELVAAPGLELWRVRAELARQV